MNETQWKTKAAALSRAHATRVKSNEIKYMDEINLPLPTISQMRQSLVEINNLIIDAPTSIHQKYKNIDENELRQLAIDAEGNLNTGRLEWLDIDIIKSAAAQVRALDHHLFLHREKRGKPDDVNVDFLCPTTRVHVIPRPFLNEPDASAVVTRTYRRRGLIWHRLIPEEINGYSVELKWHTDLSAPLRRENAIVLGALFKNLILNRDKNFDNFVAFSAPCDDEDGALDIQVAASYSGNVVVALWPELTMPPDRRKKLAAKLRRMSFSRDPGKGPAIVAAGSWHEIEKNKVFNRLHIMSGNGRECFFHDKSLPLESKTLGTEHLDASYKLPILIGHDVLVAFAICRDFCESQISNLYNMIDVDLVVVPSYGDKNTILAHRQQASNLSTDVGARAFVVQQIEPTGVSGEKAGYVLAPLMDPRKVTEEQMLVQPPIVTCLITFKRP